MPPDAMLASLVEERDSKVALIGSVTTSAHESGRDLSDQDGEVITRAKERISAIDAQLALIGDNLAMDDAVRLRLSQLQPGTVDAPLARYQYAGEVLYDVLHRSDRASVERLDRVMTRAAQHMGTDAAQTVATAGDLGGLEVNAVVGPMIDPHPSGRPFLSAIGVRPATGETFYRPWLEDTALDADYTQALQKGELASHAFTVKRDTLELTTVGNYLNVSQQLLSFQPQSLDIIVSELNRRVTRSSETAAIAEMARSTSKVTLAADADAATILNAIYQANELVYTETGSPASWITFGPKGLTRLGSLVDAAGRPLFPTIGPANAMGAASVNGVTGTIAGLVPIQTFAITDDTFWVGNNSALEAYEYRYPLLEAIEPSVLGRQLAAAAAYAFYRPRSLSSTDGATPTGGLGAVHLAP